MDPAHRDEDFRTYRRKLPPQAFAIFEGDVTLRTADHHGVSLKHAYEAWGFWVCLVLDAQRLADDLSTDPLVVASSGAVDEFQASIHAALTGFYRQSIGTLRSVVESMLAAVYFKRFGDPEGLEAWLGGHEERRFGIGSARQRLRTLTPFNTFGEDEESLLGDEGWLSWLYGLLSAFVHGRPTHVDESGVVLATTNAGIWQSNGPIYVPRAFEFWETLFVDTMLLALLLAGLSDERIAAPKEPYDVGFEVFLESLMDWHPSPGPPPISAVVAAYLCPD
jgi:hypothetical protein